MAGAVFTKCAAYGGWRSWQVRLAKALPDPPLSTAHRTAMKNALISPEFETGNCIMCTLPFPTKMRLALHLRYHILIP
jgi:hypothetical protein